MTEDEIIDYFTTPEGGYHFARWGRPIAPVVFGVEDASLDVIKGAAQALCTLAGHELAELDPELGSNVMVFFFRDWAELPQVPHLGEMIPDLDALVGRLARAGANQYRIFRFDEAGAIKAAFVFLRMDKDLAALPADQLALGQMVQIMLLWSAVAFRTQSPLALLPDGRAVLRPEIADLIRVGYDPILPAMAQDKSHALRLLARLEANA